MPLADEITRAYVPLLAYPQFPMLVAGTGDGSVPANGQWPTGSVGTDGSWPPTSVAPFDSSGEQPVGAGSLGEPAGDGSGPSADDDLVRLWFGTWNQGSGPQPSAPDLSAPGPLGSPPGNDTLGGLAFGGLPDFVPGNSSDIASNLAPDLSGTGLQFGAIPDPPPPSTVPSSIPLFSGANLGFTASGDLPGPAILPTDAPRSAPDLSSVAHGGLFLGSFIPGPVGAAAQLGDAALSFRQGHYFDAGLGGIAALAGMVSDAGAARAALDAAELAARTRLAKTAFDSIGKLRYRLGSAGKGFSWHHLVEISNIKLNKIKAEMIHNLGNIVRLADEHHKIISAFYSSKQPFTDGLTVRQWIRQKSFEEQFEFGWRQVLNAIKGKELGLPDHWLHGSVPP